MRKLSITALVAVTAFSMLSATAWADPWEFGTASNRAGTVSSVNGSSFQLRSGPTVFMHNGTVMSPRGLRLSTGMHVRVQGNSAGDGNINATEVDLVNANGYSSNGNHNGWYHNGHHNRGNDDNNDNGDNGDNNGNNGYNGYSNGNGYNGSNNGNGYNDNGNYLANRQQSYLNGQIGTIASANNGAITLSDGLTIFLNNTQVVPHGTQLRPGMQISVRGTATGDGNINASEIDVH